MIEQATEKGGYRYLSLCVWIWPEEGSLRLLFCGQLVLEQEQVSRLPHQLPRIRQVAQLCHTHLTHKGHHRSETKYIIKSCLK